MAVNKFGEVINSIYDKREIDYKQSDLPPYILSLYFSHDKNLIEIVNRINEIQFFLPAKMIYKYYFYKIPKGRRWIKWVKKEESGILDEQLEEARERLGISRLEMSKFLPFIKMKWKEKNGDGK
jgi:hypothetical protein